MRSKSILVLAMVVLFFSSSPSTFATTASFQGLEVGGAPSVSADGTVVVGGKSIGPNATAWRWEDGTLTSIGSGYGWGAYGASSGGSVVVGTIQDSPSLHFTEAFRWENGVITKLGLYRSGTWNTSASGVSADGSVVVGTGVSTTSTPGTEAILWQNGSWSGLGDLPGGDFYSRAYDISADGSVVVGWSFSDLGAEAFRWDGSMTGLGDLPGGSFESWAQAVSADGSVVVGWGRSASGAEAFRWENGNWIGLGYLPGKTSSIAEDVSADGSIIVGSSTISDVRDAFIWDEDNGMRNLQDILVNDYGLDLTSWTLQAATGVSADGLTIVGYGNSPSGDIEAWIATVPEPSTLLLLGLGAVMLRRKR
jgi:probable HAF family extracellular repeat protein